MIRGCAHAVRGVHKDLVAIFIGRREKEVENGHRGRSRSWMANREIENREEVAGVLIGIGARDFELEKRVGNDID